MFVLKRVYFLKYLIKYASIL